MSLLLCPYDGTSRIPGVRLGPDLIYKRYFQGISVQKIGIETQSSALFCQAIRDNTYKKLPKLTLGGEHLITFPILESVKDKYPNIKLIVFDAHHDAYDYPISTHYSVFYHVIEELQIPTLFLGLRYEIENAFQKINYISYKSLLEWPTKRIINEIDKFLNEETFYLSIDLDVIDPDEFSAVSAPVPNGVGLAKLNDLLKRILDKNPVSCDVVEYNAMKDDDNYVQLNKLEPLMNSIKKWVVLP